MDCFIAGLAWCSGGFGILVPKTGALYIFGHQCLPFVCLLFSGAPYLSVAQMTAGLYTYPLFVSLLAGPVLAKKSGRGVLALLLLAQVGAGLILDPFDASFSPVQILPIAAGFFYACNILILTPCLPI